ncbi:MAG: sulfur carrier protein ThiS [Hyphomicrobiaceae bacterium]
MNSPSATREAARPALALVVNGEPRLLAVDTVDEALDVLGYGGQKVATALNGEFVPAARRGSVRIAAGDRLEVVAPRQGG